MTPRLKQIQKREYESEKTCSCGQDVPYLLAFIESQAKEIEALRRNMMWALAQDSMELRGNCLQTARKEADDVAKAREELK